MPKFDSVIFNLDGTLWDTSTACALAWNNVIRYNKISYRTITAEDVRVVSGMPHELCIRETFKGLPEEMIQKIFIETIAEDTRVIRQLGGQLYPGVREGLEELAGHVDLCIISNCQSGYIENFLEFFEFETLFKDFECWGNTRKSKDENLKLLIQRNNLQNPLTAGDAEGGRKAAHTCGIPFAYMEYGFGTCSAPDHSFQTFTELKEFVLS